MNNLHTILVIAVIAIVTLLLRFLPFVIFGGKEKKSAFIAYLSEMLPYAMIGMLVIYCLRNVDIASQTHGLPELIACITVVGLHLWKKNTLLSIGAGTVFYMLLIQLVFK